MTVHRSVMPEEVLRYLDVRSNCEYIDCTFGGGGHTLSILERNGPKGRVLALDLDKAAFESITVPRQYVPRISTAQGNFRDVESIARAQGFSAVAGVLYDLGFSTDQIRTRGRGFSFREDEPLDMRYADTQPFTAADILNSWSEKKLADMIYEYGEERYAKRIARAVVDIRKKDPLRTTADLVELVRRSFPPSARHGRIHCATRTFQALRIAVNDELENLKISLVGAFDLLGDMGVIVVISFHSLEDRIVKQAFKSRVMQGGYELLTKRPIIASDIEITENPAARSAKLRAIRKIPQ